MSFFNSASTTNFGANSPTGNFSPAIFSRKVLMFFRTASVVEGITNNDYFGEITAYGDTVRIIKEPVLTVTAYTRGITVSEEALADDETTLELSKANYFAFAIDDIEEKLSHINWQSIATGSATYALKNSYDREVLEYMVISTQPTNIVNTSAGVIAALAAVDGTDPLNQDVHEQAQETTAKITLGFGASETDPLNLLSALALKLDEADIPEEGRWAVVSPRFCELLAQTDSKLLSSDYNQGAGGLKNGLMMEGKLRGFSMYKTNNAPKYTEDVDGADAVAFVSDDDADIDLGANDVNLADGTDAIGDVIMVGHMSAVATANAILKTEMLRSNTKFADIVRGLHVYGRGVLYPEALAVAYVQYE